MFWIVIINAFKITHFVTLQSPEENWMHSKLPYLWSATWRTFLNSWNNVVPPKRKEVSFPDSSVSPVNWNRSWNIFLESIIFSTLWWCLSAYFHQSDSVLLDSAFVIFSPCTGSVTLTKVEERFIHGVAKPVSERITEAACMVKLAHQNRELWIFWRLCIGLLKLSKRIGELKISHSFP